MRVVTIVGIRKSGKTSTVTALVEELRRRGKRVGTCKTVFCPTFTMDEAGSNTARHRAAGSELICARAKQETIFMAPAQLPLSRVLEAYRGMDYVLLEGDYVSPVPRLVAAHGVKDALERTNDLTLAYVGRVAASPAGEELTLPRYNALENPCALADFLETALPDIELDASLDELLPPVAGVSDDGFCQCGCEVNARKHGQSGVSVTVDGKALRLDANRLSQLRAWAAEDANRG